MILLSQLPKKPGLQLSCTTGLNSVNDASQTSPFSSLCISKRNVQVPPISDGNDGLENLSNELGI